MIKILKTARMGLLAWAFWAAGCATQPVPEPVEVTPEPAAEEGIDWRLKAERANSFEAFAMAVNNLIQLSDQEALTRLFDSQEVARQAVAGLDPMPRRPEALYRTLFGQIGDYTPEFDAYWRYLRGGYSPDRSRYLLDYRVESDNGYHWITLVLALKDAQSTASSYVIENYVNHNLGPSLVELQRGLNQLVAVQLEEPASNLRGKSGQAGNPDHRAITNLMRAYRGGYLVLYNYALSQRLDFNNAALFVLFGLAAESQMTDGIVLEHQRRLMERHETGGHEFAVQHLDLVLLESDPSVIELSLDRFARQTGDPAWGRTYWASRLLEQGQDEQAYEQLRQAMLADPMLDDSYFLLMRYYAGQGDISALALSLDTLEKKFGYVFETSYFEDNAAYAEFIDSPEYSEWIALRKQARSD